MLIGKPTFVYDHLWKLVSIYAHMQKSTSVYAQLQKHPYVNAHLLKLDFVYGPFRAHILFPNFVNACIWKFSVNVHIRKLVSIYALI